MPESADVCRQPNGTADTPPARSGRRWLRWLLALGALALFALLARRHLDQLGRLSSARPLPILGMLVGLIGARLMRAGALTVLLARLGQRVRVTETFFLNVLVTYTNLVIPRAGIGTLALYLKRGYGLSFAHYGSLTVILTILQMLAVGVLGIALVLLGARHDNQLDLTVALMFCAVTVGCLLLAFVRPSIAEHRTGRLADVLRRGAEGWRLLGAHAGTSVVVFGFSVGVIVFQALEFYLAFRALGIEAQWTGALMAALLSDLALIISITPGALGFREAAVTTSAMWLGCSASAALAGAVLDRMVMTVAIIGLAQIGMGVLALRRAGRHGAPQPRP